MSAASTSPTPPDLAVTAVSAPATALSGQTLTVSWTESNLGDPTSTGWYDAVYLSHDQLLDRSSDVYLGYLNRDFLATGANQTLTQEFALPNGLSGTYWVLVAADGGHALSDETIRANNIGHSGSLIQVNLPPAVDLAVASVSAPTIAEVGGTASFSYTVNNLSSTAAQGAWYDAVYLSADTQWDVNDQLVGRVLHSGGVAGNGSYSETLTTSAPAVVPGDYHVIVRSDIRNNTPESDESNNQAVSAGTVSVDVPVLTLGAPATGELQSGETAYYRFTVGAGETVRVALVTDSATAVNDLFVRFGEMPSLGQYDETSETPFIANPEAVIDITRPGDYYVMVRGSSVAGTEHFSLLAETVPFSISDVTPDEVSNLGSVTLTIEGAKFNSSERLEVVAEDGTLREATSVRWVDSSTLWATFDLRGMPTGHYDVRIRDDSRLATLDDAFDVTNGPEGHVAVNLVLPGALRPGQSGIVRVDYANDGGTDVAAPVIDLNVVGALLSVEGQSVGEVTFLGVNPEGPAGILQPGAYGSMAFTFTPTISNGSVAFSVGTLQASDAPINWSALEETLRPPIVDQAAWSDVWDQFVATIGSDANGVRAALSDYATTLSQIGQPSNDIDTLLRFALLDSTGVLPKKFLAAGTDLSVSATGLDLSLSRMYDGSLLGRSTDGVFGDGWTFSYDISAITDANGNVFIRSPGGVHYFTRQPDGHFVAQPGDAAELTVEGGGYLLTGLNGSEIKFRPDGNLERITDASGNSVNASWNASGQLAALTHSGGQSIVFTYNDLGRIVSATDSSGHTVSYTYDPSGSHLVGVTGAAGTTHYAYNDVPGSAQDGVLASIAFQDGTHHYFEYDASGRLAAEQGDGGSARVEYTYEGAGHVVVTDALGNQTHLLFDSNGNIAQVQDALGRVTKMQHNELGAVTEVVTPGNAIHAYSYDALGNVLGYEGPQGEQIGGSYADGTQLLSVFRDQLGHVMQYSYDQSGKLLGISYEDGAGTQYQYTPEGLLASVTNARGQTMAYSYDSAGRLLEKSFEDGTAESYSYDFHGNLILSEARDGGITTYTYDAADRLTSVTDSNGRTESYTYDAAGQLIQQEYPDGSTIHYGYDGAGRLAEMRDANGDLITAYTYDEAGRLVREVLGNGASTTYSYNAAGEVTQIRELATDNSVTSQPTTPTMPILALPA